MVSPKNRNGSRDYGLCQLNSTYHWEYITGEEFKDPFKQIQYCMDVWDDAKKKGRLRTTFYAFNVINNRPGVRDRILFHEE